MIRAFPQMKQWKTEEITLGIDLEMGEGLGEGDEGDILIINLMHKLIDLEVDFFFCSPTNYNKKNSSCLCHNKTMITSISWRILRH